jgi:hypothetical protein
MVVMMDCENLCVVSLAQDVYVWIGLDDVDAGDVLGGVEEKESFLLSDGDFRCAFPNVD